MDELTKQVEIVAMKAKYPHLIADEGNALVTAAKNARIELKAAFPGIKFRVTTSRYSGGDSLRASWIDGPTTREVDAIIDRYSAGSFDGMTDSYTYEASGFTRVFGDAKYTSTSREYSDEFVAQAIAFVSDRYQADPISVEDFRKGRAWNWRSRGGIDMGRELNVHLSTTSAIQGK